MHTAEMLQSDWLEGGMTWSSCSAVGRWFTSPVPKKLGCWVKQNYKYSYISSHKPIFDAQLNITISNIETKIFYKWGDQLLEFLEMNVVPFFSDEQSWTFIVRFLVFWCSKCSLLVKYLDRSQTSSASRLFSCEVLLLWWMQYVLHITWMHITALLKYARLSLKGMLSGFEQMLLYNLYVLFSIDEGTLMQPQTIRGAVVELSADNKLDGLSPL